MRPQMHDSQHICWRRIKKTYRVCHTWWGFEKCTGQFGKPELNARPDICCRHEQLLGEDLYLHIGWMQLETVKMRWSWGNCITFWHFIKSHMIRYTIKKRGRKPHSCRTPVVHLKLKSRYRNIFYCQINWYPLRLESHTGRRVGKWVPGSAWILRIDLNYMWKCEFHGR